MMLELHFATKEFMQQKLQNVRPKQGNNGQNKVHDHNHTPLSCKGTCNDCCPKKEKKQQNFKHAHV